MNPVTTLEAISIGPLAARTLEIARQASVYAVFERSFYLKTRSAFIAVGTADLHDGPFNLRLRTDEAMALTHDLGIVAGRSWSIEGTLLRQEDGLTIDLWDTRLWRPIRTQAPIERAKLSAGLDALHERLADIPLPAEGLIRLILDPSEPVNAVEKAAAPLLRQLPADISTMITGSAGASFEGVIGLLGLGPGLTPSGDDLLAGALIACRRLRKGGRDLLPRKLFFKLVAERTTPISHAHLAAAFDGYGSAPLHDLLDAVIAADRLAIELALDAVAKIGHSSGFDALGGVILALRCYVDQTSD